MGVLRLKYLSIERSRHGRQVCYVVSGTPPRRRIRIREELDSPGFMQAYKAAVTALKNDGGGDFGRVEGSSVYFIMYGNAQGAKVKIGTCKNVKNRLAGLRTGVPGKARIYYVTPGGTGLERELHRKFAEDRVSGEWFQYSQAIRDWIKQDEERRAHERGWQNFVRTGVRTFPNSQTTTGC